MKKRIAKINYTPKQWNGYSDGKKIGFIIDKLNALIQAQEEMEKRVNKLEHTTAYTVYGTTKPNYVPYPYPYDIEKHNEKIVSEPKEEWCECEEPISITGRGCQRCCKPIKQEPDFYRSNFTDEEILEQKIRNTRWNNLLDKRYADREKLLKKRKIDKQEPDHTKFREKIIKILKFNTKHINNYTDYGIERLADKILELIKEEHE